MAIGASKLPTVSASATEVTPPEMRPLASSRAEPDGAAISWSVHSQLGLAPTVNPSNSTNEHSQGLLGPPAGWSNGSPFYLNKPVAQDAFCFGLYS